MNTIIGALLVLCSIQPADAQTRILTSSREHSSMSYRVIHPMHSMEAVSNEVVVRMMCDSTGRTIGGVRAVVDVMTFNSGNSNRDSHAMEVVDALTYPEAKFSSTAIAPSGDSLAVRGMLQFHGVTREITAWGRAVTTADTIVVSAQFAISMTDFKIDRPSLLMIPVQDTIRFSLTAGFPLH